MNNLLKNFQFSSGSSELRFIAPNWFEMSLMKACLMLSWFSFETSSLLGAFLRSTCRLNSLVKFADNQSKLCPTACATHSLCHSNILSICSEHNDIDYELPVFRSGMHHGCLVSLW